MFNTNDSWTWKGWHKGSGMSGIIIIIIVELSHSMTSFYKIHS